MKDEQSDKAIMDYLDGISKEISNQKAFQHAGELKQLLSELQELPLGKVHPTTDAKVYEFIENLETTMNTESKSRLKLDPKILYLTIAASIALLFYVFMDNNGFEDQYRLLPSNPERLGFIYDLNNEQLASEDIKWLKAELKKETHPNIKVTIVDLLNNYPSKIDNDFLNALQKEPIPSVQMAFLDALENSVNPDFSNELVVFSQRKDLDNTVRLKVAHILSIQSKQ
jgi:hypothetical protein